MEKKEGRRRFLLAGASGLGALSLLPGAMPAQAAGAACPLKPGQIGYRVTPHIGNYYRTAKV